MSTPTYDLLAVERFTAQLASVDSLGDLGWDGEES